MMPDNLFLLFPAVLFAQPLTAIFVLFVELFNKVQQKIVFSVIMAIGALLQLIPQGTWGVGGEFCSANGFPLPSTEWYCQPNSGIGFGEITGVMLANVLVFFTIATLLAHLLSKNAKLNIKQWRPVVVVCAEIASITLAWLFFAISD